MFPYAINPPSCPAQQSPNVFIALFIAGNFGLPILGARLRHPAVSPAAMPEAAVNKDREAAGGEGEVGPGWEGGNAGAGFYSGLPKDGLQAEFGNLFSLGTKCSQDGGAFFFCEYIRHKQSLWECAKCVSYANLSKIFLEKK